MTRTGDHARVLAGIDAALDAGLKVKLNAVALKGVNEDEFVSLTRFAHDARHGHDLHRSDAARRTRWAGSRRPISAADRRCASVSRKRLTLDEIDYRTGGPARYMRAKETGGRIGFITPLTHNFCESCNRVRVTCTGTLYMCLGQEDAADLRAPLRASADDELLHRGDRRGDRPQAQGPRFHYRPHHAGARRLAAT